MDFLYTCFPFLFELQMSGREIAPNTGANAIKLFTLATKSWKLVAKLASRMFHHNLTKRYSELYIIHPSVHFVAH